MGYDEGAERIAASTPPRRRHGQNTHHICQRRRQRYRATRHRRHHVRYVRHQPRVRAERKAALRTRVLEDATRTARANAEAIASAGGCRLGKVIKMHYGWSEVRFGSVDYSLDRSLVASESLATPDIEPEDIDAQDSVTVGWELVEG